MHMRMAHRYTHGWGTSAFWTHQLVGGIVPNHNPTSQKFLHVQIRVGKTAAQQILDPCSFHGSGFGLGLGLVLGLGLIAFGESAPPGEGPLLLP
jgi:hypothetical protein